MAEIIKADFTHRRKDTMTIAIGTEENPVELSILPPTRGMMDQLVAIAGYIELAMQGGDIEGFDYSECLSLVADVMSNNTMLMQITPEYLEGIKFDMIDVGDFIALYLHFVTKLVESKN